MSKANFNIKDSGKRREFQTGSKRDVIEGKPRPALIPPSILVKLAMHYGNGAIKYGDSNWKLGQNIMTYVDSAKRHNLAWRCGLTDEPHRIAEIWNLIAIEWTLDAIKHGLVPPELDDRPPEEQDNNQWGKELYESIYGSSEDKT